MSNIYEQDDSLSQYLLLHYGADRDVLPYDNGPEEALNYPVRCVQNLVDPASIGPGARALDVGCAGGRSTFELAALCDGTLGIDTSSRFIETARTLAESGRVSHYRIDEGDIRTAMDFCVPASLPRDRAQFEVGDACSPRADIGAFEIVFCANLIDRLPDPGVFLGALSDRVVSGGQLIITSPFTWLEEFTPRENWIGGTVRDGRPRHTWDQLCALLEKHFTLRATMDLPFLIREHARKFQWSIARGGRWTRRQDED